jgi:hypothetical protein
MSHAPSTREVKAPLALLDLLLLIRSDMQARSGPVLHIGIPDTGRFRCFMEGYSWCSSHLGINFGEDNLFSGWLQEVKQAWPGEGWEAAYLRECDGDHRCAIRKYLDYVAEFRGLSPEALVAIPWSKEERKFVGMTPSLLPTKPPVASLDELLEIRRRRNITIYIGDARVERMAGYIDGYRLCLSLAALKDDEYLRFERWLQDTGKVPSGHTWEAAFLQAAGGDHDAAIHRFLDCAAAFRALPQSP